jgi:hypothetical protein
VADDEQQPAEDERGGDLRPADRVAAAFVARESEREQRAAGDEVARGHRHERRQVADDDREGDERRAPDDVHRPQGEPDPCAVARRHGS